MKINKYLLTSLCTLGAVIIACTETEPQYNPEGSFDSPVLISEFRNNEVELGKTDDGFSVMFYRQNAETEEVVPVTVVNPDASLFTAPDQVTFAPGETVAELNVTVDPLKLEPNSPYKFSFSIGDGENTSFGLQSVDFEVVYMPWENVVGPNGEEFGTFTDDMCNYFFGVNSQYMTWDVIIQYCEYAPEGVYRLVNPYENCAYYSQMTPPGDCLLYFNVSDPECVFYCDKDGNPIDKDGKPVIFTSGLSFNAIYGFMKFSGVYNEKIASGASKEEAKEYAGTFVNGAITFPKEALTVGMTLYNGGKMTAGANENGKFRLAWPGAGVDPDDVWVSLGNAEYTDGVIMPLYDDGNTATWTVEVQQYKKEPNLYRMVNPYKAGVMPDGINYDGDMYVEFDVVQPDFVTVKNQLIWADSNLQFYDEEGNLVTSTGNVSMLNCGYYFTALAGYPIDTVINAGFNDSFANNTFTFAETNMGIYTPKCDSEYNIFFICKETVLKLGAAATKAAAANHAAYKLKKQHSLIDVKAESTLGKMAVKTPMKYNGTL